MNQLIMMKIIASICVIFLLSSTSLSSQLSTAPITLHLNIVDRSGKNVEELRINNKVQIFHPNGSTLNGNISWIDTAYMLISEQTIKYKNIFKIRKISRHTSGKTYILNSNTEGSKSYNEIDSTTYTIRVITPDKLPSPNHLVIYKKGKPIKSYYYGDNITYKCGNARQYYGVINRIEENAVYFARGDSVDINKITAVQNRKARTMAGVSAMSGGVMILLLTVAAPGKEQNQSDYIVFSVLGSAMVITGIALVTTSWHKLDKKKSIHFVQY